MAVLTPAFLPAVVVVPIPTECLFNEVVPFKVFTCEKVAIPLELTLELPNAVLIPVKFAPLIAGNVPVKFAAGSEVKFAPLPSNEVAVTTPERKHQLN